MDTNKAYYSSFADKIIAKRFKSPYAVRRYAHAMQYQSILDTAKPGMRILDAGCGEGVLSVMLAKKGAIVTGCDISEPNIIQARSYAKEEGVPSITFLVADGENLPFPDNSFDLVVSSHVLEHLPDFDKGLREVMRVTTKRAVVAIPTVLNFCSFVQIGRGWYYLKGLRSFAGLPRGMWYTLVSYLKGEEGPDETYGNGSVHHIFRFPWIFPQKLKKYGYTLEYQEASSLVMPYFEFLLPFAKWLDRYKSRVILRNFGYGTTYIVSKPTGPEKHSHQLR